MLDNQTRDRYFEILELPADSTWPQIRKAYCSLKELYSTSSMITLPVEDELSSERKQEILNEIEEAYLELEVYFKNRKHHFEKNIQAMVSDIAFFDGKALKHLRKALKIDLLDIALATSIQVNHLKNLEANLYGALPRDVYTRGYVTNYAKYLSLDPQKVVADYMQGYDAWHKKKHGL